jgi:hypothetical protein
MTTSSIPTAAPIGSNAERWPLADDPGSSDAAKIGSSAQARMLVNIERHAHTISSTWQERRMHPTVHNECHSELMQGTGIDSIVEPTTSLAYRQWYLCAAKAIRATPHDHTTAGDSLLLLYTLQHIDAEHHGVGARRILRSAAIDTPLAYVQKMLWEGRTEAVDDVWLTSHVLKTLLGGHHGT